MATIYKHLSFKDKQNVFVDTTDNQYNNLNLNQIYQCLVTDNLCQKDFTNDNRKSQKNDFSHLNDLRPKKYLNSWNKSKKHYLSTTFLNLNHVFGKENEFDGNEKSANNSTLSLHIAAYENSVETNSENDCGNGENEMDLSQKRDKKWGILNHFILDGSTSSIIQNPFEFPRQQEDQANRPELMQFSASQNLLNPNQSNANNHCTKNGIPRHESNVAGFKTIMCDCYYGFYGEFCENESKSRHWMVIFFWVIIICVLASLLLALLRQKFQTKFRPPNNKLRFVDILNSDIKQ